ncbi:hypothetical protein B0H12DRAFT_517818 [Mycena haematopus]|nr:hypothetical protein B0H12DRAFT_517818 [Mycena haematopus]
MPGRRSSVGPQKPRRRYRLNLSPPPPPLRQRRREDIFLERRGRHAPLGLVHLIRTLPTHTRCRTRPRHRLRPHRPRSRGTHIPLPLRLPLPYTNNTGDSRPQQHQPRPHLAVYPKHALRAVGGGGRGDGGGEEEELGVCEVGVDIPIARPMVGRVG